MEFQSRIQPFLMSKKKKNQRLKEKKRRARELESAAQSTRNKRLWTILGGIAVPAVVAIAATTIWNSAKHKSDADAKVKKFESAEKAHSERRDYLEYVVIRPPKYSRDHSFNSEAVLVWGGEHEYAKDLRKNESISNIRHKDYAGAEACIDCHGENYDLWSEHAHRWMNVKADEKTVKGDFSGGERAQINYMGGKGEFYRKGGNFRMKLSRGDVIREFEVGRTLGSRIHQYYIGRMVEGPEDEDDYRSIDHVLPFGFELTLKKWIPIVHARGQEGPDTARDDPFETPSRLRYDVNCSMCHTTQPMGSLMLAMFKRFAAYSPRKIHFEASNYIDESFPGAVRIGLAKGEKIEVAGRNGANDLA
jgi:hypothetical protein